MADSERAAKEATMSDDHRVEAAARGMVDATVYPGAYDRALPSQRRVWIDRARAGLNAADAVDARDAEIARLREIVSDLIDGEPCSYDHHGYCQSHFWMTTEKECPHKRGLQALNGGDDGTKG